MATFDTLEEKVRSAPLQSIGVGLGAAWLLTRLPVLGIMSLALRVAFVLLRPMLLVLGGAKAWELITARRGETSQALPEAHY